MNQEAPTPNTPEPQKKVEEDALTPEQLEDITFIKNALTRDPRDRAAQEEAQKKRREKAQ